jgi:hypothetical protein
LLVNLFATLNLVGSKPAAHSFVLQVRMEPLRKFLVLGRVADKARIELNRLVQEGWQIIDEFVGKAATPQEGERETPGLGESSMVNYAGPT